MQSDQLQGLSLWVVAGARWASRLCGTAAVHDARAMNSSTVFFKSAMVLVHTGRGSAGPLFFGAHVNYVVVHTRCKVLRATTSGPILCELSEISVNCTGSRSEENEIEMG